MDKLDIEACKKENPFIVLADVIYKHLKNDIMQGLLLPGDKIVESKIAQQLDVSRTPVNIALNRALKDGWLERRSKRFLTVRKISPQECFYLYEARKFLEGQAPYLAAKPITKAELMGLKEILLNFRKGNDEPIDDELFCKNDRIAGRLSGTGIRCLSGSAGRCCHAAGRIFCPGDRTDMEYQFWNNEDCL